MAAQRRCLGSRRPFLGLNSDTPGSIEGRDHPTAWPLVLASAQARELLEARAAGQAVAAVSLDLGLTTNEVTVTPDRALLPGNLWLSWEQIAAIAELETACFAIRAPGEIDRIGQFSEALSPFVTT